MCETQKILHLFQVFVFGGRIGNTRNNDLHCLDMDKMQWSGK
jgi:hypothetical protein